MNAVKTFYQKFSLPYCSLLLANLNTAALFHQVNILRGGGGRASVVSMAEGDESAYGSVSGRSSLVSTLDRFLFLQRIALI